MSLRNVLVLCALLHLVCADGEGITTECLGCICEAQSGCNRYLQCNGDVCGLFKITWAYWADAGKPVVAGYQPDDQDAFRTCAIDAYCAGTTVTRYMARFGQDCNGDGIIDCRDYAAIHKLGGYGCQGGLPDIYRNKIEQCLHHISQYY